MPTLDDWEQALVAPRRVRVESSHELVAEVQEHHATKDAWRQQRSKAIPSRKNLLTPVAQFAPERQIEITPAYLLHRLGVVTTPPVENLADICSTWAYFRYLWAFDIPAQATVGPLSLSEDARNIDFHQKGLLSDQIGVGMAAVLLGDYLGAPLTADVSLAVADPTWPVDLEDGPSPDYLFFDAERTTIFVVECKGTQTSRRTALEQLRRGSEQVPALTFTDGRQPPPAIVVATHLSTDGTQILVIDPPGDDERPKRSETAKRRGQREWTIEKTDDFVRTLGLLSEAKLLSFAGADAVAATKVDRAEVLRSKVRRSRPRETKIEENALGTFRGVTGRFGVKDGSTIDVFQGLDATVYEALSADEVARTVEALKNFRAKESGTDLRSRPVLSSREQGALVVRSLGPDGSFLQVRVQD
jgi:hypothetical protein